MDAQEQNRKPSPSDLSDSQWLLIAPLLPLSGGGRKRTTDLREVLNAALYLWSTGCGWRHLPQDFPPEGTVRDYFHQWRRNGVWPTMHDRLRRAVRVQEGRDPEPSAAISDSQSVKATRTTGSRGDDAGKKINGRKRHLLVDTLGLRLFVVVHVASVPDRDGAKLVLENCRNKLPRRQLLWGDGGSAGQLIAWTERTGHWKLEIVKRSDKAEGFTVLPRRWVVERTIS